MHELFIFVIMAEKKGTASKSATKRKKTGGRVKGTPNKTSAVTRSVVADILSGMAVGLKERLENLDDEAFCRVFIALLPYGVAKIAPAPPDATQTATTELEDRLAELYGEI